jgi:glyoxylase-like metal-dependent hydrolase (beta-lactamase superfamily II)/rhodanese-related sulfurtransferase
MIFRQLFDKVSSTYTYLIASRKGGEALIIDPVLENVERYIKLVEELDLRLVKVIDTHIHADHISGIAELRDRTNCITIMGDASPGDVVSMQVKDNESVDIENIQLKALHTPGHTNDSFSYLMNDRIFSGDTLLIRGTGRTDFQNGDPYDAYHSIFERILKLPEDTLLYPAHDYKGDTVSTLGEEKKFNPRLQVTSADEYAAIMNNLNLPDPKMMDIAVPGNLNLGIDFARQKTTNGITVEEFQSSMQNDQVVIIDLREESEILRDGRIKDSIQITSSQIADYIHKNFDQLRNKKILMYCAVGHRSTLAVQLSQSYNLKNCFHLIGGVKN